MKAIKGNQGRSHLQQVAGAEPAVTTLEHIENELAPCRLAIRVAGEVARRIALIHLQACTQIPSTAAMGAIVSEPWQSTANDCTQAHSGTLRHTQSQSRALRRTHLAQQLARLPRLTRHAEPIRAPEQRAHAVPGARLPRLTRHAEPIRAPEQRAHAVPGAIGLVLGRRVGREAHQADGVQRLEKRRDEANGSGMILGVGEIGVALCGSIDLAHAWDAEAGDEARPYLRPEPVAKEEADPMGVLVFRRRRMHEVTAELAHILHDGALVCGHVFPKGTH